MPARPPSEAIPLASLERLVGNPAHDTIQAIFPEELAEQGEDIVFEVDLGQSGGGKAKIVIKRNKNGEFDIQTHDKNGKEIDTSGSAVVDELKRSATKATPTPESVADRAAAKEPGVDWHEALNANSFLRGEQCLYGVRFFFSYLCLSI